MQVNSVTELLGIANYKVAHIAHHSEKKIELVVQPQESKPCICSGCGKVQNTTVQSVDMVRVEDLPISGKRVFLHVSKRKSLCLEDGRIRVEHLIGYGEELRGDLLTMYTV